jgi:MSHA pilin protein MshA
MNKSMKSAQSGFTLIELIVVIVILGILAATALPKFANLGGDARLASLNAAKGALSSTSAMAHGRYLTNTTGTALTAMTIEGTPISFVTAVANTGYPKAEDALATAAGLGNDYKAYTTAAANVDNTPKNVPANTIAIVPNTIVGTASAEKCYVMYTEPAALNTPPAIKVVGNANDCE